MPLELKEKYPFSVDTWTIASKNKRHHFLTHAHSDHTRGIESHASSSIFCSSVTRSFVLRRIPKLLTSRFILIEVGESKFIEDGDDSFTVTALEANHCPGALMFMFEGHFGNVLHTGDCRLSDDCLDKVVLKVQHLVLDCIFLDCTFGKESLRMPAISEAVRQVQECILNHAEAPIVYLAIDVLGQEYLIQEIVVYFKCKIFIDKRLLPEYFADMVILMPHLLTEDPESTRFHICEGFPRLYEKARDKFMHAHMKKQPEPLFIRPSAQWYTYEGRLEGAGSGVLLDIHINKPFVQRCRPPPVPKSAERDQFGVWHVCYSMHSSRWELERALDVLNPRKVLSTTPGCKGTDLKLPKPDTWCFSKSPVKVLSKCTEIPCLKHVEIMENQKSNERNQESSTVDFSRRLVSAFGMSRYIVPASPPLSFASIDTSEERFMNGWDTAACEEEVQTASTVAVSNFLASSSQVSENIDKFFNVVQAGLSTSIAGVEENISILDDRESSCGSMGADHAIKLSQIQVSCMRKESAVLEKSSHFGLECSTFSLDNSQVELNKYRSTIEPKRTRDSSILEESTRKIYRSLFAPILSPLPSLSEMFGCG